MTRFIAPIFLLLALAFAVVGSADERYHARPTDDRGVLLAIARAPQKTRSWPNPYEGQPDAVLAGKKLFEQHCAECHGSNARGRGRAMNLHLSAVQNATPGELEWFLRNGNLWRGMPSWSGLPEQRRWQIVAYLKSLRR
ncbi:MAG: c-type cytochrome [Candidatus Acidiferrales bacterium]